MNTETKRDKFDRIFSTRAYNALGKLKLMENLKPPAYDVDPATAIVFLADLMGSTERLAQLWGVTSTGTATGGDGVPFGALVPPQPPAHMLEDGDDDEAKFRREPESRKALDFSIACSKFDRVGKDLLAQGEALRAAIAALHKSEG